MESRGLVLARCSWLSTLLSCVLLLIILLSIVEAQLPGCSIQGMVSLDLEPCLNHQDKSSLDSCCQSLNIMVKAGYHCLCLLLSSSTSSLLSTLLSLPFANCYISAPPLTQCPSNSNVPAPRILPPITDSGESLKPPPSIAAVFMPPPPPLQLPIGMQMSMNLTQDRNLTRISNSNGALNSAMPDKTSRTVKSYAYSGECRKQANIWIYPILLCSCFL